jgi:GMP synthase (glutamine-hydrolysing)
MTATAFAPVLIVQMSVPPEDLRRQVGEQLDWFNALLEELPVEPACVRPHLGEPLPGASRVCAAIISGSWSMVTDRADWSERTAQWIREMHAAHVPLFGVCYGHQLIAHALGGRVDYLPGGRELGVHTVQLSPEGRTHPRLAHFPDAFSAILSHEQSVLDLPPDARVLAGTKRDPHQILHYGGETWSSQFHPEFTPELLATCLERKRGFLETEGLDVTALIDALETTPTAARLLLEFVKRSLECPSIRRKKASILATEQ